ncbi:MAG: hypothetical protein JNJ78_24700, partial [Anaerolineae bacterium]|nr:hypothetical protein [Anaerolineae bacterium]
RLAKTLVKLQLSEFIETPADLRLDGKSVGTLTSSVTTPENEVLGLGFVKVPVAIPEQLLTAGDHSIPLRITELAGVPPPLLQNTTA